MFVSEIIDEVVEVLGRCDRDKALKRLTEAVKSLQDEGDWNANIGVVDIRTFADGDLVTLPREVETPLAVAVDGFPVFMRDEFFRFHLNGDGLADERTVPWVWDDQGNVPVFMDILEPGPIIARCDVQSDEGKLVRVTGIDHLGRVLRQQLETGEWVDGIFVPLQFVQGIPTSIPTSQTRVRKFSTTVAQTLRTSTAHRLITGAEMQILANAGLFPEPFSNGASYYIQVLSDSTLKLHNTRLDAQLDQSAIAITRSDAATSVLLRDVRTVSARTQFQTMEPVTLADFEPVAFNASAFPAEIQASSIYYIRTNGATRFTIYASRAKAEANDSVINLTSAGSDLKLRQLKLVSPVTTLDFGVRHNLITGDAITVRNSGGELPSPLLANTTYYVGKVNDFRITLHANATDAASNTNSIVLASLGSGVNSVQKVIPVAAIALGESLNITTAQPHNLSNPSGAGATATAVVTNGIVTAINITNGGSGYDVSPIVRLTGGSGTGASAEAVVSGGRVTSVRMITGGTGYTTVPTVAFEAASGSFVQFTTTGTLPSPINANTIYRAEAPMTSTAFSLNSTIPQPINITSSGSGSVFMVVSRAFSVGFLPQWQMDARSFATGNSIKFFTQGSFPVTSAQIDAEAFFYIRKLGESRIELYQTLAQSVDSSSTTGRISTISLGLDKLYGYTEKNIAAIPLDSKLNISSSAFLGSLVEATFETTGTLPLPLLPNAPYKVSAIDDQISIYTSNNLPVTLSGIGNGEHKVKIQRTLTIDAATTLDVLNQNFTAGDAITLESSVVLPSPVVANQAYYVRPAGANRIELYPSAEQAKAANSTSGRISFYSTGEGEHRLLQTIPPVKVAQIHQIETPQTDGFKRLYAWDTKREANIAFLGDVPPFETNPVYRRIRIAKNAKWVRMKYRRRGYDLITEKDFINLDSKMAILMMVQSQELLFRKFADEAERYRQVAVDYLNKRNRVLDGPRIIPIQVNADVMSNPDDWMD